ncbi:apolipoprotein N-acyltransferase [Propionivibrio limicola]|uniref:apolipoprotein N-acyltransferase n=1 Tax=Propionivibrio limicola TaxID=167645 RepID=UPI001B8785D0|nr:apolipoprotein N-acyltransferase [Propionivibrio limicola]
MSWPETLPLRLLIALLLGAASVAAFAPLGWFPVIFLTLGGLFALLGRTADEQRGWRNGALIGGAFGFGLFITGVSWIYVSLSVFGGMPAPVAGLATIAFCAFISLYPALAGALFVRFAPTTGLRRGLLFAGLWTLSEWLRGWFLTGFPWLAVGYTQTPPSLLAGFAPIFGVYGVTLLTTLIAALFHETLQRGGCRLCGQISTGLPMLILAIFLAGGFLLDRPWTTPQGDPTRVALLQGNIAQDMKWRPEKFQETLLTYYRLMRDHPAQLTILPETALPVFFDQVPAGYLDELQELAARQDGDLLFGIVTGDLASYANSAISLGASGEQRYAKSHLVPFGEFIPPGFSWFMAMANIPMSDFTPGGTHQVPLRLNGQKVAVNICYEDAFGEEIIRALPEATLLVNISNVAWFGDSLAPAQHLQIARLRALETGRMMLRATNTGMTAIIDVDGTVRAALPPFTRGALTGEVMAYTGSTPYVRWGNTPVIVACLLIVGIAAFARRREKLC